MWTVLLVEDEEFVRQTVKETVDWNKNGFQVIGEAEDGQEAFEFIKQHSPDLVISDILMPVMNGVELLKKAGEEGYDTTFIMLSCVTDFEHVRDAMEYGAVNYLPKLFMDVNGIEDVLQKAKKTLVRKMQTNTQQMDDYYVEVWDHIYDQIEIDVHLPNHLFKHFNVTVFGMFSSNPMTIEQFLKFQLFQVDHDDMIIHTFHHNHIATFFCWSTKPLAVQSYIYDKLECMAYSPTVKGPLLPEAWLEMMRCLDVLWYTNQKGLYASHSIQTPVLQQPVTWSRMFEKNINNVFLYFEQMRFMDCKASMIKLMDEVEEKKVPVIYVYEMVMRIYLYFSRIDNKSLHDVNWIQESLSHKLMTQLLIQSAEYFIQIKAKTDVRLTDHRIINEVIAYIRLNHEQQLTVKSIARKMSMNENYLSNLFSKKTGTNLIQYVQNLRIDYAKQYLNTTDMTIQEIAQKVGYENENYFSKIFKKMTSLSPKKYRENKMNQE